MLPEVSNTSSSSTSFWLLEVELMVVATRNYIPEKQPDCIYYRRYKMQRVKIAFALAIINTTTFRNVIVQTKFPSIDRLVTSTTLLELLSHRYSSKALEDPHSHRNGAIRADPCAAHHEETRAIKKEMGFVNSQPTPASVIVLYGNFPDCMI